MKKNTLEALYNLVNGKGTVTDELRNEVNAEWERTTAKSRANADLYATAHDALMASDAWVGEMTAKEIAEACADELPEGFSASKIQYAFRALWGDEIVKHDNGKNAMTYSRKE